jgi:predicted RNase H-like nuclease
VDDVTLVSRARTIVAGVDGCPGGWLALVECGHGQLKALVFSHFTELVNALNNVKVIAVDIPIGLLECGARACDEHARHELAQPRGSSVFPAPLRAVLGARSWEEACTIRYRIDGKKMSKQAWGIAAKVREVNAALREDANLAERVFEVHPEVSFAEWAGEPMPHSKKKSAGKLDRRKLIMSEWPDGVASTLLREGMTRVLVVTRVPMGQLVQRIGTEAHRLRPHHPIEHIRKSALALTDSPWCELLFELHRANPGLPPIRS